MYLSAFFYVSIYDFRLQELTYKRTYKRTFMHRYYPFRRRNYISQVYLFPRDLYPTRAADALRTLVRFRDVL